jgi:hypothetical protein
MPDWGQMQIVLDPTDYSRMCHVLEKVRELTVDTAAGRFRGSSSASPNPDKEAGQRLAQALMDLTRRYKELDPDVEDVVVPKTSAGVAK